jgi:hypothetical protein
VCVLLAVGTGCGVVAVPGGSRPSAIEVPDAVDFTWRRFDVHLEPTVVLWGRDADIDLRKLIRGSLSMIERDLDATPAKIVVQAGSYRTIPDVGIGGITNRVTGDVKITMDHRNPIGLQRLLTTWLPLALAHELHHSKRILDGPGYGSTLLESMVTEGIAEAYVRQAFPDAPPIPWVRSLTPQEEAEAWQRAQPVLDSPDDPILHEAWFLGGGELPRWAGYKIGYAIARAYLERHPDETAASLATMPAAEILSGSAYDPMRR